MFSGYLREITLYTQDSDGHQRKSRKVVASYYRPPSVREVTSVGFDPSRVFLPDGKFLLYWGLAMIGTILYVMIVVPFMVAFDVPDSLPTNIIDFVCSVLYILDIGVTFNTGFFKNGVFISSRKLIAKRYIRTWLLLDSISAFPYDWIFTQPMDASSNSSLRGPAILRMVKIHRLLKSLRLVRVAKIKMHLVRVSQKLHSGTLEVIFRACYLLVVLLGLAHWIACGFFYVSISSETANSWIYYFNLIDEDLYDQYVAAYYWAITTLTTTGYGDIHPVNSDEKVYGVCIMVIAAIVFSFVIGKIGASIASVDRDADEYRELTFEIARQFKRANVSKETIFRAMRYLDYVSETRKKHKLMNHRIQNYFSEPIRNEVNQHIYGPLLLKVEMFSLFETTLILNLTRSISVDIFAQDDVIFLTGQTSARIYFIEEGKVEIFENKTGHTFVVLEKNDYFGEIAFFTGNPRCASARCLEFCEMMSIPRKEFLSLLFSESNFAYSSIQDKYKSRNYGELGIFCYICTAGDHLAGECPNASIQINKEKMGQRWVSRRNYRTKVLSPDLRPNYDRKERKYNKNPQLSMDHQQKLMGYAKIRAPDRLFTKKFSEGIRKLSRNHSKKLVMEENEEPKMTESMLLSELTTGRGRGEVNMDLDESGEQPMPANSLPIPHISKLRISRKK